MLGPAWSWPVGQHPWLPLLSQGLGEGPQSLTEQSWEGTPSSGSPSGVYMGRDSKVGWGAVFPVLPTCPQEAPTLGTCRNVPLAAFFLASASRLSQPKVRWKLLCPLLSLSPSLFPHQGTGTPCLQVQRLSFRTEWGS